MILIKCNSCKRIMDFLKCDPKASLEWLQFWMNEDNHFCNECWLKKHKIKLPKHTEQKERQPDTMPTWPPTDEGRDGPSWPC